MTNGEKFKEIFGVSQVDEGVLYAYAWLPNHDAAEISIDWWNAEYKEPTTKNNLGVDGCIHKCIVKPTEDCISRADAIKGLGEQPYVWTDSDFEIQQLADWKTHKEMLENLPSVTPQGTKGYWIDTNDKSFVYHRIYKCSHCGATVCEYPENMHESKYKYCSGCGSRNEVETEE